MGRKGEVTKAAIRKAALVLFVQKGFKDVTMKDVCEAAGLSRGGLYMHYGSTGEIFAGIIDEIMSGLENEVAVKMENGLSAVFILDGLLERYQSEMLDRRGSLGLAFYEYYSSMPLTDDNAMLKQYYISKEMLCSLIEYGIDKGEFKEVHISAVVDLLLFSYQGVRMLSSIMPLDDDRIPADMISEIRAMLVK
ncbi:TetR family transcriptional regulator [Clostridium sp. MCC353]|uniref:TetR/AcrR family transcriptional regulator n=1 Tax=Clostridium sp. MCC353 TaxID=2592646 RepID=UPI001C027882|nr:TetR family transcriptional regulator [Clostridium sp. MCC353]